MTVTDSPFLILASKSPRRRFLLKQAGVEFTVIPSSFDESTIPETSPDVFVRILAQAKSGVVSEQHPHSWVIGADTIVVVDDTILGKPSSMAEARAMLTTLSGRVHRVLTGFSLCRHAENRRHSEVVSTEVRFKVLTPDEIEWYVHTSEPFDKAGAYAAQGLGAFMIKQIQGSYSNVVGLPVCEVVESLVREGIVEFRPGVRGFEGLRMKNEG
ncbi:MAG: nucleoside triphosphate pyrophosphatase [Pseudomonadota bacterium]